MKKSIKSALAGLLIVPALALGVNAFVPSQPVAAQSSIQNGINSSQGDGVATCLFGNEPGCTGTPIFKTVTNILLFVIGAISVIMLIIGGIRYTISGGDSSQVTGAKNTIMYALIGLVVAFLAYAVVNWVLGGLSA